MYFTWRHSGPLQPQAPVSRAMSPPHSARGMRGGPAAGLAQADAVTGPACADQSRRERPLQPVLWAPFYWDELRVHKEGAQVVDRFIA